MSNFKYGKKSQLRLMNLSKPMRLVANKYIEIARVDGSIVCTLRTLEEQAEMVKNGFSQTMESDHLANDDGLSDAFDMYPWVNGRTNHNEIYYRKMQCDMLKAANLVKVPIIIGGLWASFTEQIDGRVQIGDNCHFGLDKKAYYG
jgi:hypothetical protein